MSRKQQIHKSVAKKRALKYIVNHFSPVKKVTIFDVGANAGDYSMLLKRAFGNKAQIYCFEPSKKTFQKLKSRVGKNPTFELFKFGFGNQNQKSHLYSTPKNSRLASLYKRRLDHFQVQPSKQEQIVTKTVDSFCADHNINHIHFLKLDTEGSELAF